MKLNYPQIIGRCLVLIAVTVGALNLHWSEGKQVATGWVVADQGDCIWWRFALGERTCPFTVQYRTKSGVEIQAPYFLPSRGGPSLRPRVGHPVQIHYHSADPLSIYRGHEYYWWGWPLMLLIASVFFLVAGRSIARGDVPKHYSISRVELISRAKAQIASAKSKNKA